MVTQVDVDVEKLFREEQKIMSSERALHTANASAPGNPMITSQQHQDFSQH